MVPLSDKDVPLMAAILSPLEGNQQRTMTEVFHGYQELSADEQEQTILNVGGLGLVSDHYRLNTNGSETSEAYQDSMNFSMIPTEVLGEAGDAQYPDIVLFADTVEPSPNGTGNSYKLQSRGPVVGKEDTAYPRFYVSSNKTISRQFAEIPSGLTVHGAFAGNIGGYIGQDGTLKIRFSISRFFLRVMSQHVVQQSSSWSRC